MGIAFPWIIVFIFLLMGSIPFQLVAEERRKKLFTSLRRIGLLDTAYWAAWFITFQVILISACLLALVFAVGVRTRSSILRAIGLDVIFLLLWLTGTAFTTFSFFLAAFCSSSSVSTALAFTEFIVALITIVMCFDSLNYYSIGDKTQTCLYISSSYNKIYSSDLMGYTFVQFLVFFLPFFHSAQAISDILSIVQYNDQTFNMKDLATSSVTLAYSVTSTTTYESKWVQNSFGMLAGEVVVYLFLAYFAGQLVSSDGGEGKSFLNALLPASIRKILFVSDYSTSVETGDIRGEEREKSRAEHSIRAYKLSKTYSGVQALKEVSFSMKSGEVFCMVRDTILLKYFF